MGKNSPSINTRHPEFFEDPIFRTALERLEGLGGDLTSFNFGGNLEPLQDTISTSPETTKLFLEGLEAQLAGPFEDAMKQVRNELAANNQLESSVATDRFADLLQERERQFLVQGTEFGLADTKRALENRIRLFGLGLDTTSQAGVLAQKQGALRNEFELQKFQNEVDLELANQPTRTGGLFGGLTGAVGGGLSGFALGGPVGAGVGAFAGGLSGAMGPEGTGGAFLQSGTSIFGSSRVRPGSSASNDIPSEDVRFLPLTA